MNHVIIKISKNDASIEDIKEILEHLKKTIAEYHVDISFQVFGAV
jgi:hypothetical protein